MKLLSQEVEGQSRPVLKPEERLLLAVVESAFWDLQSPDPTKRRTACRYFLDDEDDHTFSFVSICQHFSWSPVSIRFQLGPLLASVPLAVAAAWSPVAGGGPSSGG